ncbi:hypothetical protein ACVDG2_06325 [Pseudosulfitobacter sp. RP-4]
MRIGALQPDVCDATKHRNPPLLLADTADPKLTFTVFARTISLSMAPGVNKNRVPQVAAKMSHLLQLAYFSLQESTPPIRSRASVVHKTHLVTPARKGQHMSVHRTALQGQITK